MRREFFPLFCQFFQIFVYIILNLAIGQLVGFGEDDREGYSIFSQPFHEFQVYFLRFQTAVYQYKQIGHLLAFQDIILDNLLYLFYLFLATGGIPAPPRRYPCRARWWSRR